MKPSGPGLLFFGKIFCYSFNFSVCNWVVHNFCFFLIQAWKIELFKQSVHFFQVIHPGSWFLSNYQCDSYQSTNGIFHRTRTKTFTIHMETVKTLNSQSSLEKEEWSWRNQSSWLQIILHSYSHEDTMVLAQKQKYRPMEQDRKSRDKPTQ